jgi:GTP-binding protein EngB required for normal cell division
MNEWNRTFQKSEEKFFLECDTGDGEPVISLSFAVLGLNDHSSVPVIVVFTKFAKLRSAAKRKIKEQLEGLSEEERSRRITERVKKLFKETGVLDKLSDSKNRTRPKSYVSLEGKWSD